MIFRLNIHNNHIYKIPIEVKKSHTFCMALFGVIVNLQFTLYQSIP